MNGQEPVGRPAAGSTIRKPLAKRSHPSPGHMPEMTVFLCLSPMNRATEEGLSHIGMGVGGICECCPVTKYKCSLLILPGSPLSLFVPSGYTLAGLAVFSFE